MQQCRELPRSLPRLLTRRHRQPVPQTARCYQPPRECCQREALHRPKNGSTKATPWQRTNAYRTEVSQDKVTRVRTSVLFVSLLVRPSGSNGDKNSNRHGGLPVRAIRLTLNVVLVKLYLIFPTASRRLRHLGAYQSTSTHRHRSGRQKQRGMTLPPPVKRRTYHVLLQRI